MPTALRVVRGLWASAHPGPTAVVTVLAVALGLAAGLPPWQLALLATAVFTGQLSVGISNDAIDVVRDRAVGRVDKPLARGEVAVRTAWAAALAALVVALAVSAVLGLGMLVAHAIALASAWAYNGGVKATPFSVVPFVVSFGLFPSLATLSASDPGVAPWWACLAGAALGAAVHLTNVLPDLDDDRRTGIRGLPHRLGARPSAVVAAAAVEAGAVAVLLGATGGIGVLSLVFFVAVTAVALVAAVLVVRGTSGRIVFRLVMLAALLLAAQLVATGAALTA
ncbi:MAG: UbiA family prenyltransferase [Microbacterium sp.]|uniref:UbiA family prenyltransferase n=1 Tax=Microbacterium sp. TaxID=51671 RepID=UPI0039E66C29